MADLLKNFQKRLLTVGSFTWLVFRIFGHTFVRHCSSITNWAARLSRERFHLKSPNFTWISIPTDLLYSPTEYDVTNCFKSEVVAKNQSKMPPPMVSYGISWERFMTIMRGPPNFKCLSGPIGFTNLPDMTSLATSGRLQNAINYCTKVRKSCTVHPSRS